jgi:hypothetical protein
VDAESAQNVAVTGAGAGTRAPGPAQVFAGAVRAVSLSSRTRRLLSGRRALHEHHLLSRRAPGDAGAAPNGARDDAVLHREGEPARRHGQLAECTVHIARKLPLVPATPDDARALGVTKHQ